MRETFLVLMLNVLSDQHTDNTNNTKNTNNTNNNNNTNSQLTRQTATVRAVRRLARRPTVVALSVFRAGGEVSPSPGSQVIIVTLLVS